MKKTGILILIVLIVVLVQNCSKKDKPPSVYLPEPDLPATPYNYIDNYPPHIAQALLQTDNTPASNPITNDGATLGRVLFYDRALSKNNRLSCAGCHRQTISFADWVQKSDGFNGGKTKRHAMRLVNVRFYASGKMLWDERASSLEEQVLMPIQDSIELGMNLPELVTRLSQTSFYPGLFKKAFGSPEITPDRISKALAQFVRSIVTYQSKYDRVKQGLESFTADEQQGEQLFLTGPTPCAGCHTPPMFLNSNPAAPFGVEDENDRGINNEGRFKAGSLRNVDAAAHLFHDGSAPSPGAVYRLLLENIPAHGSQYNPNAGSLLAFLKTLTDNSIRTDARFSDPFRR